MNRRDFESLVAAGYHCELRYDGCAYRPVTQWVGPYPACDACARTPAARDMLDALKPEIASRAAHWQRVFGRQP